MKKYSFSILLGIFFSQFIVAQSPHTITLAFGSCNREELPQDYWPEIEKQNPDLWIWMGDNIYGDSNDTAVLASKYRKQKSDSTYTAFRKKIRVIGTWDDHDYGVNDGGREFAIKEESKILFMDFMDIGKWDPMRNRAGIYWAQTIEKSGVLVKIIMLDTRTFRDSLFATMQDGKKVYLPNASGDILGEAQWLWFENEIKNSKADVHIICTSIQIIPEQHRFEKWSNFPKAREKMFALVQQCKPKQVVFISGDRHIAEVSAIQLPDYPGMIHEITSSGLTHVWNKVGTEENKYRMSELYIQKNFGILQIYRDTKGVHTNAKIYTTDGTLLYERVLY